MPLDGVRGPCRLETTDIAALNRLFSEAFTDRYHRDGMTSVKVPELNPSIWEFAIEDADAGAMVWKDDNGDPVAFNLVHRTGSEGWMGPLAVHPTRQREGLGAAVVTAGIDFLRRRGVRTIGLETMPRTVDNINFYSRLGFLPGALTVTMVRQLDRGGILPCQRTRWSRIPRRMARKQAALAVGDLVHQVRPGADFSQVMELTRSLNLGDTTLLYDDEVLTGCAIWHGVEIVAGRVPEELRVLKLAAVSVTAMERLLKLVESDAALQGLSRVSIRVETDAREAYSRLVQLGYRVLWTDLRMTLDGYPLQPRGAGVAFSNWEI